MSAPVDHPRQAPGAAGIGVRRGSTTPSRSPSISPGAVITSPHRLRATSRVQCPYAATNRIEPGRRRDRHRRASRRFGDLGEHAVPVVDPIGVVDHDAAPAPSRSSDGRGQMPPTDRRPARGPRHDRLLALQVRHAAATRSSVVDVPVRPAPPMKTWSPAGTPRTAGSRSSARQPDDEAAHGPTRRRPDSLGGQVVRIDRTTGARSTSGGPPRSGRERTAPARPSAPTRDLRVETGRRHPQATRTGDRPAYGPGHAGGAGDRLVDPSTQRSAARRRSRRRSCRRWSSTRHADRRAGVEDPVEHRQHGAAARSCRAIAGAHPGRPRTARSSDRRRCDRSVLPDRSRRRAGGAAGRSASLSPSRTTPPQ